MAREEEIKEGVSYSSRRRGEINTRGKEGGRG